MTYDWLARKLTMPAPTELVIEVNCRAMGRAAGRDLPEVGYLLHPSLWGQRDAGGAMRALIPGLFQRPGVDHLTADIDPENLGAVAGPAGISRHPSRGADLLHRRGLVGQQL